MTNFERLADQAKGLLQIKLDGHVEACVHAAHSLNLGMEEALSLAAVAFLRECAARQFDRTAATALLDAAMNQVYPQPVAERPRRVS